MELESLSHGEQQLLALSRVILRKRAMDGERCILILDEATSSLDVASETTFHQVIREEFRNDTVIAVAHRLETLKDCDKILVLEKGKIADFGTPGDVIDQIFWNSRDN
jgi:ATP-binding cassette, subfamily C (CFTR/MRP), member 1